MLKPPQTKDENQMVISSRESSRAPGYLKDGCRGAHVGHAPGDDTAVCEFRRARPPTLPCWLASRPAQGPGGSRPSFCGLGA